MRVDVPKQAQRKISCHGYDDLILVFCSAERVNSLLIHAAGRTIAMVDALNRRTTYSYNARDQRIKTTYADGSEVAEEFDAVSRRSASVDQAGTRTAYAYDKLGRLTSVTDTLNQVTAYGWTSPLIRATKLKLKAV